MATTANLPTQEQLLARFQALQQRIQAVEAAAELFHRFKAISNRIDAVEHVFDQVGRSHSRCMAGLPVHLSSVLVQAPAE